MTILSYWFISDGDIILWEEDEEPETPDDSQQKSENEENESEKENKVETESDSPILEISDDLEQLQNLPIYNPDRALSVTSLKPFSGFICELCDRTFETEELSQVSILLIFMDIKNSVTLIYIIELHKHNVYMMYG